MTDTVEDMPSEIHEYCYQLGLKSRDIGNTTKNMDPVVADDKQSSEVPSSSPAQSPLGDVSKTTYDCKNCARSFTNSRQYLKHKCSTKERSPSPKPKSKSVPKRKKAKQQRVGRNLAAKVGTKGMEPTAQVDEDPNLVTVHMKDHTYNRDDEMNESPSLEANASNSNEVGKDPKVQCELCRMFPDTVNTLDNSQQCEKCQALSNKESTSTMDNKTIPSMSSDKKRKYTFKKPEEFCPHCNKSFHSEKRLAKHEKVCGKDLVCEFCGKDFNGTGQHHIAYAKYEEHYYTHVEEKPFHCNVCNKGFVRKPDLQKHNVIHTAEYEPQTCMECGAVFATTKLLNKHKRKHARPTWDCPKCKKKFVRQVIYEKHVQTCQVQVSCEVCGKIFTCLSKNVKYRYQEHMFIHTGEKPYKCQYCEHAFRDRSTRKKHERTHTGEKPYKCTLCDRSFSQLRILRNHVRTHTGEKPFACQLCDLRFAKHCNLKYHIRVHTKEKPYTCELCHRSFTQSGTYHKHMRRHQSRELGSHQAGTKTTSTGNMQAEAPSSSEAAPKISIATQVEPEASMATEVEPEVPIATEAPMATQIEPEASMATEVEPEVPIATEAPMATQIEPEASMATEVEPEVPIATEVEPEAPMATDVKPEASMATEVEPEVSITTEVEQLVAVVPEVPKPVPVASEPEVANVPTESAANEQVVQEIPIAAEEITIIVSEGNASGTTLATIDVEQITNMFASCS